MTEQTLQNLLMEKFSISKDSDGDFLIRLSADEDYPDSVSVYVRLRDTIIRVFAISGRYMEMETSDAGALLDFVNSWNTNKYYPKAYIRQRRDGKWDIETENIVIAGEGVDAVSDAYVQQFISRNVAGAWQFFVRLNKGTVED